MIGRRTRNTPTTTTMNTHNKKMPKTPARNTSKKRWRTTNDMGDTHTHKRDTIVANKGTIKCQYRNIANINNYSKRASNTHNAHTHTHNARNGANIGIDEQVQQTTQTNDNHKTNQTNNVGCNMQKGEESWPQGDYT